MGEQRRTGWGVGVLVLPLLHWVTTANRCSSPGLGLPVARGKDWIRWSLRAHPAATFSRNRRKEDRHSRRSYCVSGALSSSFLRPPGREALSYSTDQGSDAQTAG